MPTYFSWINGDTSNELLLTAFLAAAFAFAFVVFRAIQEYLRHRKLMLEIAKAHLDKHFEALALLRSDNETPAILLEVAEHFSNLATSAASAHAFAASIIRQRRTQGYPTDRMRQFSATYTQDFVYLEKHNPGLLENYIVAIDSAVHVMKARWPSVRDALLVLESGSSRSRFAHHTCETISIANCTSALIGTSRHPASPQMPR